MTEYWSRKVEKAMRQIHYKTENLPLKILWWNQASLSIFIDYNLYGFVVIY